MMHRQRGSDFRIFTLDTGRLNQETYDCMDAIRDRYGVRVEVYFPDTVKVQDMVRAHGLFERHFTLGEAADSERITAAYDQGMLSAAAPQDPPDAAVRQPDPARVTKCPAPSSGALLVGYPMS